MQGEFYHENQKNYYLHYLIDIVTYWSNFFRNSFIINNIFSAQEQYSNITDYHYIAEDINGKTDVYQNENYILVNINDGNSITLKNFNTGKAKLYSKKQIHLLKLIKWF